MFIGVTDKIEELSFTLPYLGNLSLAIRTRLQNSINRNLPFCKIKVIFKSTTRLGNFFRFKDKVTFNLRSNVVYKFSCGRCNATYYGETCRHLNIRVGEHSGVSPLTGKKSKTKKTTAIKDHIYAILRSRSFPRGLQNFWQVVIQNFTLRSKKVF